MSRSVLIVPDRVYGYRLHVSGLPSIWCGTREIALRVYASMLPF